jgi:hypothetical protein
MIWSIMKWISVLTCGASSASVVIAHCCVCHVLADYPGEHQTVCENMKFLKTYKSMLVFR